MAQTLTMTLSVDADLWKDFDRAASRLHRQGDELLRELMREFVGRNSQAAFAAGEMSDESLAFDFGDTAAPPALSDQIDLEEFLKPAPALAAGV